jgi:hypothetical protein
MDLVRADDQVGADGAVASEPVKVRGPVGADAGHAGGEPAVDHGIIRDGL